MSRKGSRGSVIAHVLELVASALIQHAQRFAADEAGSNLTRPRSRCRVTLEMQTCRNARTRMPVHAAEKRERRKNRHHSMPDWRRRRRLRL